MAYASKVEMGDYTVCRYDIAEIVDEDAALSITDGRHPVVEAISKERFVPNDTLLDGKDLG